jgi:hypothetical protein
MSPVQNVLRQLAQRRLWPVAILLVAALAAVPMMLAKDPEPTVAPPAPAADKTDGDLATEPIVSLAEAGTSSKRRRVLGAAKNPFRVDPPKDEEAPVGEQPEAADSAPAEKTPSESGSGGTDPVAPPAELPTAPTPVEPDAPAPKKQYERNELTVRFGGGDDDAKRQSVKRLEPLPSAELPVLIYVGVRDGGKVAEFLLDAGVTAIGDGECFPSADACETIRLREGETEFLDVKDEAGTVVEQYQLDLVEIHNGSGAKASKAKAAKAKSSRSELRSVAGRVSSYLP